MSGSGYWNLSQRDIKEIKRLVKAGNSHSVVAGIFGTKHYIVKMICQEKKNAVEKSGSQTDETKDRD
jgi:hypothetical protein